MKELTEKKIKEILNMMECLEANIKYDESLRTIIGPDFVIELKNSIQKLDNELSERGI